MSTDTSDKFAHITQSVERYYTERFRSGGATASGVDWRSEASQRARFDQLLRVVDPTVAFSLLDYGCGYGALRTYVSEKGLGCTRYLGFDLSEEMISHGRGNFAGQDDTTFTSNASDVEVLDYAVASGIFNVKQETPEVEWKQYVRAELEKLNSLSARGFAFNILTSYSDADKQRPDLYYADPLEYFDLCKRQFAPNVALLHDYGLFEFTILVRKRVPRP